MDVCFKVFDDTALYYFWEDELQGYQSDGYIGSDRKINDGTVTKSLVVKNWTDSPPPPPPPTPEPEYGSLKVTKTVAGDRLVADPDLGYIPGNFTFTLTLTGEGISGTQIFGERLFTNGVATFMLHDGQSAEFTGIPAGVGYLIEEAPADKFITTYNKNTGVIPANATDEVSFTNTWNDTSPKNSFTLADSRKLIIKSLPVGARYEIRETDTGGVRFNTFSINEKGVVLREAEKNKVVFSNQRFTLPQTGGDGAAIGLVVAAAAALMLGAYLIFEAVRKTKQVRKP